VSCGAIRKHGTLVNCLPVQGPVELERKQVTAVNFPPVPGPVDLSGNRVL